jgi:hypothetical protein
MKVIVDTCNVLQMPSYINYDVGTIVYFDTEPYKHNYYNGINVDFLEVPVAYSSCIVRGEISSVQIISSKQNDEERDIADVSIPDCKKSIINNITNEEELCIVTLKEVVIEDVCRKGFDFCVERVCYGWQQFILSFGTTIFQFNSSYLGNDALTELITTICDLDSEKLGDRWNDSEFTLYDEPGIIHVYFRRKCETNSVMIDIERIDIVDKPDYTRNWHIVMEYDIFKKTIIDVALAVLKKYGLRGLRGNWCACTEGFPISTFLRILLGKPNFNNDSEEYRSDIFEELEFLKQILSNDGTKQSNSV